MSDNLSHGTTQLTLAEILAQPTLGLNLVTSDLSALSLAITGAHSFEISRPTRWFSAHWIALTTGLRLKGRPDEQRELVAELHRAGIAALGFALDINFRSVPSALLEAAEKVGLPVFTVPFDTGFAEIIAFVNQALLSPNVNALRRFVSVQDYLLDSLLGPDAVQSLIDRLAPLIPAEVALVSADGELVTAAEGLSMALLGEIVAKIQSNAAGTRGSVPKSSSRRAEKSGETQLGSLTQLLEFPTSAGPALALSVVSPTQPALWLTLVKVIEDASEPGFNLALPLIRSAGHILSIALETRNDKKAERRASARALISELCGIKSIKASLPRGARSATERLLDLGIDFSLPVVVACGYPVSDLVGDVRDDISQRAESLVASKARMIWDVHSEHVVVILQCEPDEVEKYLLYDLGASKYSFGISEAIVPSGTFAQAYREACASVLEVIRSSAYSGAPKAQDLRDARLLHFANCSMVTWLLAQADEKLLAAKQAERQSALALEKNAIATIRAYLESNLDINRAAGVLGIHPNSMRYRLKKVRELKDVDLDNFSDLVNLYLALRMLPLI